MERIEPPAVVVLAGDRRGPADSGAWEACFFAELAPDGMRGIERVRYSFAFCRLLRPGGDSREAALAALRNEAALCGYDRVRWFSLLPPMTAAERELLEELKIKLGILARKGERFYESMAAH